VAPDETVPDTVATRRPAGRSRSAKLGHLQVSELASDRAAAPSPFGDDQTFPLPLEDLTYAPITRP